MEDSCVFCKIIRGEIPCASVLDTPDVLAFLDINPIRPGHTLVVPKVHAATLFEMSPKSGEMLVRALQQVGKAVMEATGATGLNVQQNNFPAGGQTVHHIHWHLIPRVEGDGLSLWPQGAYADMEAMSTLAKVIASRCGKA